MSKENATLVSPCALLVFMAIQPLAGALSDRVGRRPLLIAFGGTAEYVALWFEDAGMESGFYWYVTACAAVSLVVYVTMRETRDAVFFREGKTAGAAQEGVAVLAPGERGRLFCG